MVKQSEYTNVGMGMVPHKKNCRCEECELDRLRQENSRLRTERNAMAEYVRGMPCPYECENGLVSTTRWGGKGWVFDETPCPHEAKLRELGITEDKDCHADAWGWERGEDQQ